MKIRLVKPAVHTREGSLLMQTFRIQDVALPLLAALTPEKHTIKIVDESFAPDDPDEDIDLVGLSVCTDLALRAYQIADHYRKRGAMVAMGGIHSTIVPDEVAEHCDAIVIGEGDRAWQELVCDAEDGKLQKFYRAERIPKLVGQPIPRRDLYPELVYRDLIPFSVGIEASRGCPYDCEFCSVHTVGGHIYRMRPVEEIIAEIESIDSDYLVFVDDNMALNQDVAKKLFKAMIPLKRQWVAEGNTSLAHDLELLTLMRRSGCLGLQVGFESIQPETIQRIKKLKLMKIDHAEAVRRFHDAGIAIMANFIFGFDHDSLDVFDQTLDFAIRVKLDFAQFRALVPYPGTRLYDRLLAENRLIDPKWWLNQHRRFGDAPPAFYPCRMSLEQLADGLLYISEEFYSFHNAFKRFFGIKPWHHSCVTVQLYLAINRTFGQRYQKLYNATISNMARMPEEVHKDLDVPGPEFCPGPGLG